MQYILENIRKEHHLGSVIITSLHDINLKIEQGRFYSIFGPSGSGKSRILHIMGCMDVPSEGKVLYNGRDLATLNQKDAKNLRNNEIGFIQQSISVNTSISVYENVAFMLKIINVKESIIKERVTFWLQELNLWHKKDSLGIYLNSSDLVKVSLAKALVKEPQILLIDEPFEILELTQKFEMLKLIQKVNRDHGITMVMATKSWEEACQADVVYLLRGGHITDKQNGKAQIQMAG